VAGPIGGSDDAAVGWSVADIPDLAGRVAVVTGANGGLGFETTRALAARHAHVVMTVRSPERAIAARDQIRVEHPTASLELVQLDTSSLASVRAAAERILEAHRRLDILINNAGVMAVPFGESVDGHELQLATNHLGHFVLTAPLARGLLRAEAARIVSISSTGRFLGGPLRRLDPPVTQSSYSSWAAYGRSKRAAAQLTVELNRRLVASGATARAIAADPGFARTDLQARSARESRGLSHRLIEAAVSLVGSTPSQGALPQLRAATDPAAIGGALYALRFVVRGAPVRTPYLIGGLDPAAAGALWAESERLTGVRFDVDEAVAAAKSP
jgi:NAD(P)-dependent dehydrogenase (short-subunit alcohol dehydrogenase family)